MISAVLMEWQIYSIMVAKCKCVRYDKNMSTSMPLGGLHSMLMTEASAIYLS